MAYGLASTKGVTHRSQKDREQLEVQQARTAGSSEGFASGALKGAAQGASLGMAAGPLGAVAGTLLGGLAGAAYGGYSGGQQAAEAKKAEQESKRRSDILARQTSTAQQQEARMARTSGASRVKAPPTSPSGGEAALMAMPAASGKGTAYDAWRSTVYGG